MEDVDIEKLIKEKLREAFPPVFARHKVGELSGGLVSSGTCANADSAGTGPAIRLRIGRHTAYERESFISWLLEKNQPLKKGEQTTN